MESKYRIVRDNYLGYEAQVKHWWFPFLWFEISKTHFIIGINTNSTADEAKALCCHYKRGTLKRSAPKINNTVWESDSDKQFCQ